jgi:DNA modification methylase
LVQRQYQKKCDKCGAVREDFQIGLEETPDLYVWHMVQVFREVRRVLNDEGTLWLNLGDSYNSQPGQRKPEDKVGTKQSTNAGSNDTARNCPNLKPKDLIGIPWRVAFALQADGWWLRSDIIWAKPAPMPESVTDRPTRSHEHIFLLAKSERYYYDSEAVKEPAICGDPRKPYAPGQVDARGDGHKRGGGKVRPSVERGRFNGKTEAMADTGQNAFRAVEDWRNLRDVWMVGPQPFPEAHFATFPPRLIEPCVIAGSPVGGLVLDPFTGAGTTALVAKRHGRSFVGVELKREYCEMVSGRLSQEVLSFE